MMTKEDGFKLKQQFTNIVDCKESSIHEKYQQIMALLSKYGLYEGNNFADIFSIPGYTEKNSENRDGIFGILDGNSFSFPLTITLIASANQEISYIPAVFFYELFDSRNESINDTMIADLFNLLRQILGLPKKEVFKLTYGTQSVLNYIATGPTSVTINMPIIPLDPIFGMPYTISDLIIDTIIVGSMGSVQAGYVFAGGIYIYWEGENVDVTILDLVGTLCIGGTYVKYNSSPFWLSDIF